MTKNIFYNIWGGGGQVGFSINSSIRMMGDWRSPPQYFKIYCRIERIHFLKKALQYNKNSNLADF